MALPRRVKGKAAVVTDGASGIGRATFWAVDVSNEDQVRRELQEIVARFGRINILVNNAGIAGTNKPTHELAESDWDAVFAVDVKGVFFCTKHIIPHMREAGGGSRVRVNSVHPGHVATPVQEWVRSGSEADRERVIKLLALDYPWGASASQKT